MKLLVILSETDRILPLEDLCELSDGELTVENESDTIREILSQGAKTEALDLAANYKIRTHSAQKKVSKIKNTSTHCMKATN